MSGGTLPPHPGPRPADFHFPFAEAAQALAAIEDLIDDVASMVRGHLTAVIPARVGFEGRVRREFDGVFEELMREWDSLSSHLNADASALESAIGTARTRQRAAQDAIAAHERARQSYDRAVEEARAEARAN